MQFEFQRPRSKVPFAGWLILVATFLATIQSGLWLWGLLIPSSQQPLAFATAGGPLVASATESMMVAGLVCFGVLLLGLLIFSLYMSLQRTRQNATRIASRLTQELSASEFRWRFATEVSGDGLWDWDAKSNRVFFSERWKAMLGVADQKLAGNAEEWRSRLHPDDRDRVLHALHDYLSQHTESYQCEHRMQHADGHWVWVLDRGLIVSRDAQGNPERLIGTISDISERKKLEENLRELAVRFETVANRVPGMVYSYQLFPDGSSCFPYASGAMIDVYGVDPEAAKHDATPVLNTIHPDDVQRVKDSIQNSAATLSPWQEEYRAIHPDGSEHWLIGDALPRLCVDGSVIWYGAITNITQRKLAELGLQKALVESSRFRDALDRMDTFVFMKDRDLRYTYANQATLDRLAISREELLGTQGEQVFDQPSLQRVNKLDRRVIEGEAVTEEVELNIRGERSSFLQIKTPMYEDETSNNIVGLISITTDITDAKRQAQAIEHLAHYDALTGLPNRNLLADRLNQAMAMVDRRKSSLAVIYLDLDGFKSVNDTYGHSAGDEVLIALAHRLRKLLRKEDTLSRLGGDEFAAVLIDMSPEAYYEPHLKQLLQAASDPILLKDATVQVSASLGVTFYPQPDVFEGEQLLRQADQAMYQAKLSGKSRFQLFDAELDRNLRSQHETVERVRQALNNDELCLYYQPKVNMRTSEVIGAEALLRWQHPDRGLLPPGAFIGVVESTSLMLEVGQWVMQSALKQMDQWLQQGERIPLSINISAIELRHPKFVEQLERQLKAWPDIEPSMLELEVLETAALGDLGQISQVLSDCRRLGVSIAIDDFGTGYSSLTYFKRLPARVVKIDQSFVRGILRDPADLAILDGIVRLADALGRQLIAEGVETHEHAEMLLRIGCDLAQGYGVAKPMPAEAFLPWRQQWHAPEHWRNLKVVSRRALPALYAGVDHRAWVERFRNNLQTNDETVQLNPDSCGFGAWLNEQSQDLADVDAVLRLHTELHQIAAQIDKLHRSHQRNQIPALMNALEVLSDQLFHEMEQWMESIV